MNQNEILTVIAKMENGETESKQQYLTENHPHHRKRPILSKPGPPPVPILIRSSGIVILTDKQAWLF